MTPELLALLAAVIAGAAIALCVDRRAAGSLLAGEAVLLGIGASAFALLVLSVVGYRWSRWSFLVSMLVVIAAALVCGRARPRERGAAEGGSAHTLITAAFLAATIILLAGYALLATIAPIWEFDFIGDWGLKARAFALAGRIDWSFLEHPFHHDIHPDYPPLLPLAFDVLALMRGAWNDATLGILNVAFAAGLLLVVHGVALRDLGRRDAAAFVAFAVVPLAAAPWIGIAEGPFIAYATAGLLLVRGGEMTPGAVMLGLAASTKNEGLTLIMAAALALVVARRARDVVRLWPAVVIALPWLVLRSMHALPTDITSGNVVARIVEHLREPAVFAALVRYPLGKPLFWIGLAAGVWWARRERFVLVALAAQLLFYIGAYLATPHDVAWHVRWSWERLIAHLTPALAVVILLNLLAIALRPPAQSSRTPA